MSESDDQLWQRMTRDVKQIVREKPVVEKKAPAPPKPKAPKKPQSEPEKPPQTPVQKTEAVIQGRELDKATERKLSAGKMPIEARLDLHGMRQAEAHAALRRFLHASSSKDYRTVLIITGKGFARDNNERSWEGASDRERGVLRRMLPNWLEQPEFRGIVVGYTSAGPRHGGDGAFYVQLRNLRRRS